MHRYRADYKYFLSYRTRWSDNDQYAHLNNSVYYYLIDSIVNTYLEERCGCSPKASGPDASENRTLPPIGLVVSSHCVFRSPLSFPQVIDLGLRVSKLGSSSVTYEVGFFLEGDANSEASAVGGYTHVFVDRSTRKTIREGMSRVLRNGLQALFNPLAEDETDAASQRSARSKAKL